MLRALHLGPMELALWYRRRPDEDLRGSKHGHLREAEVRSTCAVQEVDVHTDTRDVLAHARRDAKSRGLQDWFVCDIDAHHVESVSWKEIVGYIEDPVVREMAIDYQQEPHRRAAVTG